MKQSRLSTTISILLGFLILLPAAFAKPDFSESKRRWLNECGNSLWAALQEFGPRTASYNSDDEKVDYVTRICIKHTDANVKDAMSSKRSLEQHACDYVSMMGDIVRGFNNKGSSDDSLYFGAVRCQNIDATIAKRNGSKK